jgi:hypothetical protein
MGTASARLDELRPVTFVFRNDVSGTRQYGLIAEDVAKVFPELVVRDENGRIDGVRYEELTPMLLNQVQQQAKEITEQKARIAAVAGLRTSARQQPSARSPAGNTRT